METPMNDPLTLAPVLDLSAAQPLRDALLARRGAELALDASQVERMGGQCLAVLLAAARDGRAAGHALAIANPSEGFTQALALMGLDVDALERGGADNEDEAATGIRDGAGEEEQAA